MSVINSVLKDLERRNHRFTPIEIETLPRRDASSRDRWPLLLIGLLTAGLALAGGYIVYQQDRLSPVTTAVLPAPVVKPPVVPVAAAVVPPQAPIELPPPNEIRGLQISETESGMRMEFVLGERVVAFLRERGENYFSYHLRDIESRVEAPLMRDNPWIVGLEVTERDGGVDISFETAADVLVETRQKRAEDDVLWAISLRQAGQQVPVAAPAAEQPAPAATVIAARPEPAVEAQTFDAPAEPVTDGVVALVAEQPPAANGETPAEVRLDIRSTNPEAQTADRLAYAIELMNSRRHAEAESLLRGMLGGDDDVAVREHLLALYAGQGKQDRYTRLARESMLVHPGQARFLTEFARSLVQARAWHEAIELLGRQERLDPDQQALLAASYQRLDRHESAVRHYRLALAENATDARNWVGLAISLEHTAALAEALDAYRRAGRLGQLNKRLQAFVARRSETLQQVLN